MPPSRAPQKQRYTPNAAVCVDHNALEVPYRRACQALLQCGQYEPPHHDGWLATGNAYKVAFAWAEVEAAQVLEDEPAGGRWTQARA
jgi:hypothetical protein